MNEEELKDLWRSESSMPEVDFTKLENSLNGLAKRLRTKIVIDFSLQGVALLVLVVFLYFRPKAIWGAAVLLLPAAWYLWELFGLYKAKNAPADKLALKESVKEKVHALKSFLRAGRIATYAFSPIVIWLMYYAILGYDFSALTSNEIMIASLKLTAISLLMEVLIVIICERYYKALYTPALKELEALLTELESGDL
jgi:hypothetical protein